MIPYGKQYIDDDDIKAVVEVLKSDWLTTGPKVEEFEQAVADYVGSKYAVAVNSGTAALHCAMYAIGIGPGDEVIVPPMTFVATANCIVYQGGTPVFVDVEEDTLLIDPDKIEEKITPKTKAIIAVDFAGQPCDYDRLREITNKHNLILVADSCHALGAEYKGKKAGSLADLSVFSFHPVKHITTGEGGMITTDDKVYAERMKQFRSHGIATDCREREKQGTWFYEMIDLGYNYRLTDLQCALGLSQIKKIHFFLKKRREFADRYNKTFANTDRAEPLTIHIHALHAWHLYIIKIKGPDRNYVFQHLRESGIGANVHYIPVHLHPFYKNRFDTNLGLCPVAEKVYKEIISLPLFPSLNIEDFKIVMDTVKERLSSGHI